MSDRALRELERAWRAEPRDDALAALLEGYRRVEQDPPLDVLRASPRWRRLTGLVRKWHLKPLRDRDGATRDLLVAAEERLGVALPRAVREWFLLVGRRLVRVQAHPMRHFDLRLDGGLLALYTGDAPLRWGCRLADLGQDDPPGVIDDHGALHVQHDTTSELLLTIALSETLHGAWVLADERSLALGGGPFGELEDGVRGAQGFGAGVALALERAYAPLPLPAWRWPREPTRFFGDGDTIVRICGDWVQAATRAEAAWARLDGLVQAHGGWDGPF